MLLLNIPWNPDPVLLDLFGTFQIRYYSLLFVSGLLLGYYIVKHYYKQDGLPTEQLEQLAVYIFTGVIVGARLGHCLFYEPAYYLSHPLEMFLPIKFTAEGMKFIGFQGLASHGGGLGVIIAGYFYTKKYKVNYLWIADKVGIATALTGSFIRFGNLMNSEIIGAPTDVPWGFVFTKVDTLPRHPAQLYEAIAYMAIFILLHLLYQKKRKSFHNGFFFGMFLALVMASRFFIEFLKRDQVAFENGMLLNMGQLLSIPFILTGLWLIFGRKQKNTETAPQKQTS